jgi:hypothetical protein
MPKANLGGQGEILWHGEPEEPVGILRYRAVDTWGQLVVFEATNGPGPQELYSVKKYEAELRAMVHAVYAWEHVTDQDGKPLECNPTNREIVLRNNTEVFWSLRGALKKTSAEGKKKASSNGSGSVSLQAPAVSPAESSETSEPASSGAATT